MSEQENILKKHLKIVVGCSTFADSAGLLRMIPSLYDLADEFAIVEGRYEMFHLNGDANFDPKTKEVCKSFDKVSYYEFAGYQPDKRQYVADIVAEKHEADILFIVDSDEYLHPDPQYQDIDQFRYNLALDIRSQPRQVDYIYYAKDIFSVLMWMPGPDLYEKAHNDVEDNVWIAWPRLWHKPGQFEYFNGVHYWIKRKSDPAPTKNYQTGTRVIDGIRLMTDTTLRSPEFRKARDKWAWDGLQLEKGKIREFRRTNPSFGG